MTSPETKNVSFLLQASKKLTVYVYSNQVHEQEEIPVTRGEPLFQAKVTINVSKNPETHEIGRNFAVQCGNSNKVFPFDKSAHTWIQLANRTVRIILPRPDKTLSFETSSCCRSVTCTVFQQNGQQDSKFQSLTLTINTRPQAASAETDNDSDDEDPELAHYYRNKKENRAKGKEKDPNQNKCYDNARTPPPPNLDSFLLQKYLDDSTKNQSEGMTLSLNNPFIFNNMRNDNLDEEAQSSLEYLESSTERIMDLRRLWAKNQNNDDDIEVPDQANNIKHILKIRQNMISEHIVNVYSLNDLTKLIAQFKVMANETLYAGADQSEVFIDEDPDIQAAILASLNLQDTENNSCVPDDEF